VRKILARLAVPILVASLAPLIAMAAAKPAAAAGPCGTVSTAPAYTHVIWIWMENHSYGDIIGNTSQAPYINSVANECGLATNYHNLSHPSLPNYVGATSGLAVSSLTPFDPDCDPTGSCVTSAPSIFGQGESWKAYEESMPSNCLGSNSGEYAVRHNPPPYFTSLSGCSTFDVPYTQLATDLANNTLPAFSFVTPNLIDDMHDGTINQGDTWLSSNLPTILNSSAYTSGSTAVFITWDEGSGGSSGENCVSNTTDASCHVATIVVSPSTPVGVQSATLFSHYSLLGTTEQLLGLPLLGQAASAATMTSAFNLAPTSGNTVTVTNPGSQTATVGTAASLQITASDSASGQTLTYSATGLPAGLSINSSTGLISGTPTTAGTSSVTVTATDTTGASGSASFTWTVNPVAGNTVTVTNPGAQSTKVNTAASLQITATDSASGQTLTYSATGLPAGLSINSSTGLISGTPTTTGSFNVTVTATDTTGATGSATFSWRIRKH
jgi:phosphatidylinositol-3-phosphatase